METQTELSASLTRYRNYLAGRNVSEHTAVAYITDLRQFFTWLLENDITATQPGKITATHISDFLSYLSGLGRSGVARVRKLAAIREFLKYLVDVEKTLPSSPR
jgi:site-specific recombinase XerD